MTRLCVLGPSGRMGRMLIELAQARPAMTVTAAVDRADSPVVGTEVCPGVVATADLESGLAGADAYIDFTSPGATAAVARVAAGLGVAGIIGTTGLDDAGHAAIAALAEHSPVVYAPNFSAGIQVLLKLAERAARALGPEFDMEVVEIHHRHKRDAPSGTAMALATALATGRTRVAEPQSQPAPENRSANRFDNCFGRHGDVGPRRDEEIGVLAVRGGDVIGEHTAYFLGAEERIEITHRANSRAVFAAGALRAAAWAVNKPPGRYDLGDVLAL